MIKWLKIAAAAIGTFLLALVAIDVASKTRRAGKKDQDEADRLNAGITDHLDDAKDDLLIADAAIDDGLAARETIEDKLDHIGESDADIDSIADRANRGRVRRKPKSQSS